VNQLATKIAELVHEKTPDDWLWKGTRIHLIDGTTLTMPDTPENQQKFPQQSTFKQGDIVMGDAFFGTYFLLAQMIRRGIDVLFE
jgi:hypothetical protein